VLLSSLAGYSFSRPNATDLRMVNAGTGEDVTVRDVESFQFSDQTRTLAEILSATAQRPGRLAHRHQRRRHPGRTGRQRHADGPGGQ
jgi:hypothetical protein